MNDMKETRKELGIGMKQVERELTLKKVTIFNFLSILREMIGCFTVMTKFSYQVGINGLENANGQLSISQVLLNQARQIQDLNARLDRLEGRK